MCRDTATALRGVAGDLVIGFAMGGGFARESEMVHLGDVPPQYMASELLSANAGIVCSTPASIAAFVEYCYQEALAIIEQTKSVVLALARALIDHPERTLDSGEIDQVILQTLTSEAAPVERARRAPGKLLKRARPNSPHADRS